MSNESNSVGRRTLIGGLAAGAAAAAISSRASSAMALPLMSGSRNRIDVHCHHIPDFYRVSLAGHGITEAGGKKLPRGVRREQWAS